MDNKQILLDRALEFFSQRGYDAVGVREVVEAAGVTKPTLYHYFESKRGLLDALLQREGTPMLEKIQRAADYQRDLVMTLETIARAYFQFVQDNKVFYRLQMAMVYAPPESEANQAIRAFSKRQYEILEEVFIKAAEDHGNLRGRHKRYAAALLGQINVMVGLFLNDSLELTNEVTYLTIHQFMYGIFS